MRDQISTMIQSVVDGNASACEVHSILKNLQSVIEIGLKVIQGGVIEEAREFNKGESYFNGTWEIRNTPTYLDFSKDEVFMSLNKAALARKKELNDSYKASVNNKGFFDESTGEQIPVLPIKSPSKEICVYKSK